MRPLGPEADDRSADAEDRLEFRMEIVSNNGDALEKMGRADPSEKGLLRKLFDLFF